MSRITIAVVGLGAISQSVHLPLLRRNAERFTIAALVDLSRERGIDMAARYGAPADAVFTSVADLTAQIAAGAISVDAAILATAGSHGADTLRLLQAGLVVLAEKPLAYSRAEINAISTWAAENDIDVSTRLRVGYMKEYDAASDAARVALADVKIRAVSVQVLHPADGAQIGFARLASPTSDVDRAVLSGAIAATAHIVDSVVGADAPTEIRTLYTNVVLGSIVHDIGLVRFLLGGIGNVTHAEHFGTAMPGSVHVRASLAEHAAPLSIDWHFIDGYPDYRETVTVHHETGSIELEFAVPYVLNVPTVLRITETQPGLGVKVSEARWMQQEAFENELFTIEALVRGESRSGASLQESLADVTVGQRIIRALSAAKGHVLHPSTEASQAPQQ